MDVESQLRIKRLAAERGDLVIDTYRRLHRIPELGNHEKKTTEFIVDFLAQRGVYFEVNPGGSGGVAVIGEGEPAVLLRADIDGLPVTEKTGLPHSSGHHGCMHACGHDTHTAMLLAAVDALVADEARPPGRIVCVFQHAEEGAGGCKQMVENGLLDDYPTDASLALHVWPARATGKVGLSAGPLMASMDELTIEIKGRGGHGAYPQDCVNPIIVGAEIVTDLSGIRSTAVSPLDTALVSVGMVQAGTGPNIIPETATIRGTIRSFDPDVRGDLIEAIELMATGVAKAHGAQAWVKVEKGCPVVANDPGMSDKMIEGLRAVVGEDNLIEGGVTMGSEDMSYILQRVPGCYVQLGCSGDPDTAHGLHSPFFAIDEGCLKVGVEVWLTGVETLLRR